MPLKKTQRSTTSVKEQPQSYVCLLRTLTRKSIIGFGLYPDLSVMELMILNKMELAKMYYGLGKITFTDDILEDVGITDKFKIDKPSKGREFDLLKEFKNYYYDTLTEKQKLGAWSRANSIKKHTSRIKINNIDKLNSGIKLMNKNHNKK